MQLIRGGPCKEVTAGEFCLHYTRIRMCIYTLHKPLQFVGLSGGKNGWQTTESSVQAISDSLVFCELFQNRQMPHTLDADKNSS